MARGGGFSGGGRGGGFSGGGRSGGFSSGSSGRSGGFSSGSRSSGGGFSSGNFSSFKKSSGATPPSNPTPVHTNRSSFLTGALVGSALSSRSRGSNAYYSGGVSSNDVFPEVSGSNYTPRNPQPPKGREYMYCEYCGSEYNDLNTTKCSNCGAKTTRKREEVKTAGQTIAAPSSQTAAENKKKSNKIGIVIGIAIVLIVLLVAILPNVLGTNEFEPITYNWDGGNYVDYTSTANYNDWIYGDILSLKVLSSSVVDDLSSYGISHSRYNYCVTTVRIVNTTSFFYYFYISDLTLKAGGKLYIASSLGENSGRIFSDRSEDGCIIIPAGEDFIITLIFPMHGYQNISTLSLEFEEFAGNDFLGAYLIYLG